MDTSEARFLWQEDIFPVVFSAAVSSANPVTIFLGGQPGAGKTASQARVLAQSGGVVVPIVGDDFRQFHPEYERLVNDDPLRMPQATAGASAAWIKMSVDYANAHRISTLIEGTWRRAATVLDEAANAKALGRGTHAVVVAVPPVLSRLGILNRYYIDRARGLPARWTPIGAHDEAVANLPDVARAVVGSGAVDRFSVMNRDGDILWSGSASRVGLESFTAEFDRALTDDELSQYWPQVEAVERAYCVVNDGNREAKALIETVKAAFAHVGVTDREARRAGALRAQFGSVSFEPSTPEGIVSVAKRSESDRRGLGKGSRPR